MTYSTGVNTKINDYIDRQLDSLGTAESVAVLDELIAEIEGKLDYLRGILEDGE